MSQFAQDGSSLYLWSWSPLDQLQKRPSGLMEPRQDNLGGLFNYISFWQRQREMLVPASPPFLLPLTPWAIVIQQQVGSRLDCDLPGVESPVVGVAVSPSSGQELEQGGEVGRGSWVDGEPDSSCPAQVRIYCRAVGGGCPPSTPLHALVCEGWGSPSHWIPKLLLTIFSG